MPYQFSREQAAAAIRRIRSHIQRYFSDNHLEYAIFGKSEGLDSSVIAGLLSDVPGVKPIGVLMPCESDPEVEFVARRCLDHFRIPSIKVDLTSEYHSVMSRFYSSGAVQDQLTRIVRDNGDEDLLKRMAHRKARAAGNIKVRLRMITLYHLAQLTGGLVVSTDNLSEYWMGFWSLNGDVGDYAPIQSVWKGLEEGVIAEVLGIPEESLRAVPTDGLDIIPGGTDEDQLGLPYGELDRVIVRLLQTGEGMPDVDAIACQTGLAAEKVRHVARQLAGSQFKRRWPCVVSREDAGLEKIEDLRVVD
jgi:NH3-dependent NAD+ synthetase